MYHIFCLCTNSSMTYNNEHTILVWTLNFYLIESTSKFISDCNLLANTIISANNILKRTINLDQYLCILHVITIFYVRYELVLLKLISFISIRDWNVWLYEMLFQRYSVRKLRKFHWIW